MDEFENGSKGARLFWSIAVGLFGGVLSGMAANIFVGSIVGLVAFLFTFYLLKN